MWNIGNSTEDHRGREGNLKGEKTMDHRKKTGFQGGGGDTVTGTEEDTCDEHCVLYITNEPLNTSKTNDVPYNV